MRCMMRCVMRWGWKGWRERYYIVFVGARSLLRDGSMLSLIYYYTTDDRGSALCICVYVDDAAADSVAEHERQAKGQAKDKL